MSLFSLFLLLPEPVRLLGELAGSLPAPVGTETTCNSDGATTIQVCENKVGKKDGENPAPKLRPLETMFAWLTSTG